MKNKILIVIFTILTFGIFLMPKTFAYSVAQLDYTNRVVSIGTFGNGNSATYYFNTDLLSSSINYRVCVQIFDKDDLNTPINATSVFGSAPQYYVGAWTNMTNYNTYQNYGYYTSSYNPLNYPQYNYIVMPFYISQSTNYVVNICIAQTQQSGFIGHFVPNTYYDIDGFNNKGVFQYTSSYLSLDSQVTLTDTTDYMVQYNKIYLGAYLNTVYNANNVNSYQYHLFIQFDGGVRVGDLPNLSISYLEIEYININGALLSYNDAKTQYPYLYNNVVLYNNNASLFVSSSAIVGYENNIIYEIRFRLPDFNFKSSSYYDSSFGLLNYLKNVRISSMSLSEEEIYNNGFKSGNTSGYDTGFNDGYNKGVSETSSGFDNLMFAIGDVPMKIISSMLNFEILGFNLLSFFMGIITLVLFIHILRKFKE